VAERARPPDFVPGSPPMVLTRKPEIEITVSHRTWTRIKTRIGALAEPQPKLRTWGVIALSVGPTAFLAWVPFIGQYLFFGAHAPVLSIAVISSVMLMAAVAGTAYGLAAMRGADAVEGLSRQIAFQVKEEMEVEEEQYHAAVATITASEEG
jgi:hypothetical protein